jgi:hypothetical protein
LNTCKAMIHRLIQVCVLLVKHPLALIRFRATPILKKLTGSLNQDFRWRVHDN